MSVLNRAMFNQTVNRQEGSPVSGEENFFEKFASLLRGQAATNPIRTEQSDDSTVYNFGEYGGSYDLKEQGFQRVLRNYLPEGADLFVGNPRDYILSPEGMDAIELFRADILKTQEANRAMGSPITGEGINGLKKLDDMRFRQMGSPMQGEMAQPTQAMAQQNPENVGIMQGFEDDARTIVDAGSEKKEQFDKLVAPVLGQLDKGIIPWDKPWQCEFEDGELSFGVQRSASTNRLYTGWNSIVLQCIADEQG